MATISKGAIFNSGGNEDRYRGMLRGYYRFNEIFVVDAAGNYVCQPNVRLLFERGADDGAAFNMLNAGYVAEVGGALAQLVPTTEFTNCFKGGALSDKGVGLRLLSLGIEPLGVRYMGAASNWNTAAFVAGKAQAAANMGIESLVEAQIAEELIRSGLMGLVAELLGVGEDSSCSNYLGIPQLFVSGLAPQNSGYPSMGTGHPAARWTFADDVYAPAATGDSDFNPNRIRLRYGAQGAAWARQVVGTNPGWGARTAADIVCVDYVAILDYARVVFEEDAQGKFTGNVTPYDEIDARKIAAISAFI